MYNQCTCTETAITFNRVVYDQKDSVSMGSSLDSLLGNVIITELDHEIIKPLINENTIKFYGTYVGDVIKRQYVHNILSLLNNFDKSLSFTVDLFENEVPHFLNLQFSPDGYIYIQKECKHRFIYLLQKLHSMGSSNCLDQKFCVSHIM